MYFTLYIDIYSPTVQAQAGIRLRELNSQLAQRGLALRNLGSIDEQSIAGAICTGTHGTGWHYGIIATDVLSLKLMTAAGEIIECSETQNPDVFAAARCSIGALGIIIEVTMQCEKLQFLESYQYSLPFEEAMSQLTKIARSAEHVRVWWFPHTDSCLVWQANRTPIKRQPTFSHVKKSVAAARDKLIGYRTPFCFSKSDEHTLNFCVS
jgi:L-gulonolactone oxidase